MSPQWLTSLLFISLLRLTTTEHTVTRATDLNNDAQYESADGGTLIVKRSDAFLNDLVYYRLLTASEQPQLALEIDASNPTFRLRVRSIANEDNQWWRFVHLGDEIYNIHSRNPSFADEYSLDIVNNGISTTPYMAPTGHFTGQRWHLTFFDDLTFGFWNEFAGNDSVLCFDASTRYAQMTPRAISDANHRWLFAESAT